MKERRRPPDSNNFWLGLGVVLLAWFIALSLILVIVHGY
jgi:hypothetical protein